jgi:asparagine synthase (glutamine-hydrolysing)
LEPFYYYFKKGQFIFGSSIPDIINNLPHTAEINTSQVLDLFSNGLNTEQMYSDETCYQDIYRVEPGHKLTIKSNQIQKTRFWQLDKDSSTIHLKSDAAYLEHFSELMSESIKSLTADTSTPASEFSGGIDSSSILIAAQQNGIQPALFRHIPTDNRNDDDNAEYINANEVIKHLRPEKVYNIDATFFDPISTFQHCALIYAGAPPFVFFMLANNIHQAVVAHHHDVLLSGFGGDECVSGHAPMHAYLRPILKNHNYKKAWSEFSDSFRFKDKVPPSAIKRFIYLLQLSHPALYSLISSVKNVEYAVTHYLKRKSENKPFAYARLQDYEYDLLQGPRSHHVRMRVEYSAVLAKSMGFEYRYPLLNPKLVEFCFRLPPEQKRRNGINRYLVRRYLAQFLSEKIYNRHQKTGSLMPATFEKCKHYYLNGTLDKHFTGLPFIENCHKDLDENRQLFAKMYAYMFKVYFEKRSSGTNF